MHKRAAARAAGDPVAGYVGELGAALAGPARAKADILAEVSDGLTDAAEAYEAAGLDRAEARRRAVADFGPVAEIAAGFQAELLCGRARLLAVCAVVVPLSVLASTTVLWSSSGSPEDARRWREQPDGVLLLAQAVDASHLLSALVGAVVLVLLARSARRGGGVVRLVRGAGVAVLAVQGFAALAGWLLNAVADLPPEHYAGMMPATLVFGVGTLLNATVVVLAVLCALGSGPAAAAPARTEAA
ncbi:permease prefix domain 1-containing protein [Allonocardiopsis opalescens]|uniref:Uncharacterized protein n=1 Tax=Allonocardiopsis opalescens TaxID=1144618 RepID=A0A2T0QDL4_9ACTN|nr:permease prefix domain 1-containing protein [Allonocardiopsis opalescens]PRY02005.1 hypothetical protein CLV72_101603 [Allonocardiopsis opalescens]